MSQFIKQFISAGAALIFGGMLLTGCGRPAKKSDFSRHAGGYYYQLISFSSDTCLYRPGYMNHLLAGFYTQADSLFWDSDNNLGDNFFIAVDSAGTGNFLKQYMSRCAVGDSACLLVKTKDFFEQQFKTNRVPFFSETDSVVKIRFKVKGQVSARQFEAVNNNRRDKEQAQIRNFYPTQAQFEQAKDSLGFYWVQKGTATSARSPKPGQAITLHYRGSYLNGRFLEESPDTFELVYGVPDQLLKGLNYVIGKIKIGQNVKIILPSRLAFGENGSANGIIPPYTPLLYELKITDIK